VVSSVGMSSAGSMGWGGREAPIGLAGELPAALVDRPMLGPAQQHQVGQVGGAAIQPVPPMMGLPPGQRPLTVSDHAAAVADGQGVALAGGDDPGGAAQVQGLAGGAPQGRGEQGENVNEKWPHRARQKWPHLPSL
jgi:hypothetical protein